MIHWSKERGLGRLFEEALVRLDEDASLFRLISFAGRSQSELRVLLDAALNVDELKDWSDEMKKKWKVEVAELNILSEKCNGKRLTRTHTECEI